MSSDAYIPPADIYGTDDVEITAVTEGRKPMSIFQDGKLSDQLQNKVNKAEAAGILAELKCKYNSDILYFQPRYRKWAEFMAQFDKLTSDLFYYSIIRNSYVRYSQEQKIIGDDITKIGDPEPALDYKVDWSLPPSRRGQIGLSYLTGKLLGFPDEKIKAYCRWIKCTEEDIKAQETLANIILNKLNEGTDIKLGGGKKKHTNKSRSKSKGKSRSKSKGKSRSKSKGKSRSKSKGKSSRLAR